MSCWAIVAINGRLRRKQRLRGELDVAEREALTRYMLERVLTAAGAARAVAEVVIVSPESDDLPGGYTVLRDAGTGLNRALQLAREHAGVRDLVLLPADLPMLESDDVDALIDAGRESRVAIAPDHSGTGTNGLYLAAGLDFACRFGAGSRARHETEARRLGIVPALVERPGLAADLDTPADLHALGRAVAVAGAGHLSVAERA